MRRHSYHPLPSILLLWSLSQSFPLKLLRCEPLQSFSHAVNLYVLVEWYHGAPSLYQDLEYRIISSVFGGNGACSKRESESLIGFMAITPKAALCPGYIDSNSDSLFFFKRYRRCYKEKSGTFPAHPIKSQIVIKLSLKLLWFTFILMVLFVELFL